MTKLPLAAQKPKPYITIISIIVLILFACIIYSNSLKGEFVFDDLEFIATNNYVKSFDNIRGFWMEGFPKTRATVLYSFALNYQLGGLNVFGYHLFNLLIHIITTLCVFQFVRLILTTPALRDHPLTKQKQLFAFCVAALFGVHPVQTQAVTYITQRFASMATMFYMATLCFYLKGRLTPNNILRPFYFIGGLLTMILALGCKEISITIPLMFLLMEHFFFASSEKPIEQRNKNKKTHKTSATASPNIKLYAGIAAFFILVFIIFNIVWPGTIAHTLFTPQISESHDGDVYTFFTYFLTQTRVWIVFLRLLFLPINQNLDYDFPMSHSFFEPAVLGSLAVIIGLFVLGLKMKKRRPLIAFGIFWFFLTLSVNFVPRVNVLFEHKLYLVSIGFCIAIVALVLQTINNKKISLSILAAILCIFAIAAYQRNKVWKTEFSVWQDVLENSPDKGRPNQNMGKVYIRIGQYREALKYLNKALEANPEDYRALTNRGVAHYHLGMLDKALADLDRAIEIKPKFYGAYSNRGLVYQRMGEFEKALESFNESLRIKPNFALGYSNRADLHNKMGNMDLAFKDFSIALKLEPYQTEIYNRRAIIYFQKGMFDHAISDFNRALKVNPNSSQTYANRGFLYLQKGIFDFALQDLNRALQLNPNAAEALNNRGSVFLKLNKYDLAMHDFTKTLQLNPNHSSALYNVGAIHFLKGELEQALFYLNKSIAVNPNYGPAYWLRANCYEKKGDSAKALESALKAKSLNYPVPDSYLEELKN